MCLRIIAPVLLCASISAFAQPSNIPSLGDIPLGILAGNAYSNEVLGVIYRFPNGWTTVLEPRNPQLFGADANGPANRCTRTLLRIEASGTNEAGFSPWGVFFAIDPKCLAAGPFPQSDTDKDAVKMFADRLFQIFKSSPFVSPDGAVFYASRMQGDAGPVIVSMLGQTMVHTRNQDSTPVKLSVTTVFAITESQGYWVGWAAVADDPAKEDLARNAGVLMIQKEGKHSPVQAISKLLTPGLK